MPHSMMSVISPLFLALAAWAATPTTAGTVTQTGTPATAPVSLEALFRPAEFGTVTLSPNGKHIAVLVPEGVTLARKLAEFCGWGRARPSRCGCRW